MLLGGGGSPPIFMKLTIASRGPQCSAIALPAGFCNVSIKRDGGMDNTVKVISGCLF